MEILYTQNPLEIKIYLDDKDRKILQLNLEIEDLEEIILDGVLALEKDNVVEAKKYLDVIGNLDSEQEIERKKKFVERSKSYENELQGIHIGDCTAVAASCHKCHAERLVGIDTLGKISKGSLSKISSIFRNREVITCADAIKWMEIHTVDSQDPTHRPWLRTWQEQHDFAIEYLKQYQEKLKVYKRLTPALYGVKISDDK